MMSFVYLSYGSGIHEQEVVYSLYSALRWGTPSTQGFKVIIYTDRPQSFQGLPVSIRQLTEEELTSWAGPSQYIHRRKIVALADAVRTYGSPTILIDADTYFRGNPSQLLPRVSPGRTLLHIREGRVGSMPRLADFSKMLQRHRFEDLQGRPIPASPDSPSWNTGVLGIHPVDAPLLQEVLHLTDALCQKTEERTVEQLAASLILSEHTRLRGASDVVTHYWTPYLRYPFESRLSQIMAEVANLPLDKRALLAYSHRPKPTLPRRGVLLAKRAGKSIGLLPTKVGSREW